MHGGFCRLVYNICGPRRSDLGVIFVAAAPLAAGIALRAFLMEPNSPDPDREGQ